MIYKKTELQIVWVILLSKPSINICPGVSIKLEPTTSSSSSL